MSVHFSRWGVQRIGSDDDARVLAARARSGARRSFVGERTVDVFRRAQRRWHDEPRWRDAAVRCAVDFRGTLVDLDREQIDGLPGYLDPELWRVRTEVALAHPRALDGVYESAKTDAILAYRPLGVVLHVCPGNSFVAGIDSFLHGIVSGNANVAKLSRSAPAVAAIVAELLEASGLPKGQIELAMWESGSSGIEDALKGRVDGVVVWGGDGAVRHYREGLPSGVRLIEHGPKLSFSVLTARGLGRGDGLDGLVRDVCRYEQASCTSSQALLVEIPEAASTDPDGFARYRGEVLARIAAALRAYGSAHPPAPKTAHEQMEMLKVQERARLATSRGQGEFISGYPDWLAVWMPEGRPIEPSCLFRTWLVYGYRNAAELDALVAPIRHYLQTAGVACADEELPALSERLWALGVNRIVEAGGATVATIGAPHDGGFLLHDLCRTTSLESPSRSRSPWQGGTSDDTLRRLGRLLEQAAAAPFYAARFEAAHVPIGRPLTWDAFEAIPWLVKGDLTHGPPLCSDLLTTPYDRIEHAHLFTTGGSTGEPKFALYSRAELDELTDIWARQFALLGVRKGDRFANLFTGGDLWAAFITTHDTATKLGCLNLPMGGKVEPARAVSLLKTLGVTVIFGTPSTILLLARAAEEARDLELSIPKILYGGEMMTDAARAYIQRSLRADWVRSGAYAAVDGGTIGYQCAAAVGNVQHVLEGYCYVEICDDETGRRVPDGEPGELVMTNLSRTLQPVVRLRTGDRARRIVEPCPCGAAGMRIELLGRSDDVVRAGGGNVHLTEVDRTCEAFPNELSLVYQLRFTKADVVDAYELVIESKRAIDDPSGLAAKVTEAYLSNAEMVRYAVEHGMLRLDVRIVSPGSIPHNAKTGKLKRIVDSRG